MQKKSREESSGAGSGIEILTNEPYADGPGGSGQYTRKIYHIGSHLPGWIKSLLPKSALTTEEEAWNAYPYTKTRFTCPFVEKFALEIETYYFADAGQQENVFRLSGQELRNRVVDLIDVVRDQTYGGPGAADYVPAEDPAQFRSEKTGRGPLADSWLAEHWAAVQGREQPTADNRSLMCAYKLCRVEFGYWGMQTKLERFIHDVALRKTMLRAHRQAWAWQDEWHGMTMDDIRELERQTQLALQKKMGLGGGGGGDAGSEEGDGEEEEEDSAASSPSFSAERPKAKQAKHVVKMSSIEKLDSGSGGGGSMMKKSLPAPPQLRTHPPSAADSGDDDDDDEESGDEAAESGAEEAAATAAAVAAKQRRQLGAGSGGGVTMKIKGGAGSKFGSKGALHSPVGSTHSFDLQVGG